MCRHTSEDLDPVQDKGAKVAKVPKRAVTAQARGAVETTLHAEGVSTLYFFLCLFV